MTSASEGLLSGIAKRGERRERRGRDAEGKRERAETKADVRVLLAREKRENNTLWDFEVRPKSQNST